MNPIISIHIPKTAGTSLTHSLAAELGAEKIMLDYMGQVYSSKQHVAGGGLREFARKLLFKTGLDKFTRKVLNRVRQRGPESISDEVIVIHGHFKPSKYLTQYPNAPLVTMLRDPLERMWSNYQHWIRISDEDQLNDWFTKEMSFEEYVFRPEIRNLQTTLLENRKVEEFAVIGVQEHMREYLNDLSGFLTKHLGREINLQIQEKNVGSKKFDSSQFGEEFLRKVREWHSEDYSLYQQVLERIENRHPVDGD